VRKFDGGVERRPRHVWSVMGDCHESDIKEKGRVGKYCIIHKRADLIELGAKSYLYRLIIFHGLPTNLQLSMSIDVIA